MVLSFFKKLYFVQLRYEQMDRLDWSPSKRGWFKVKPFYKVLTSLNGSSFPWRSI